MVNQLSLFKLLAIALQLSIQTVQITLERHSLQCLEIQDNNHINKVHLHYFTV